MRLAQDIAAALSCADGFVSGEQLARDFGVTRAAVWKAIEHLRESGLEVSSARKRGYRLDSPYDALSLQVLEAALQDKGCNASLIFEPETASTNNDAKELARQGAPDGTLVVADMQSTGRGRRGKGFFSPAGCGIYLSLIVGRKRVPANPLHLTAFAGVAACQAIEEVFGKQASIKWVNDVYVDGRKACGILTEAEFDLEANMPAWAVVGIGVNVYEPTLGWPKEIAGKAGSVASAIEQGQRARLVASIVSHLDALAEASSPAMAMQEYRERSCIIGKDVLVQDETGESRRMKVLDILDDLSLQVVEADSPESEARIVSSSRVSILLDDRTA